MTMRMTLAMGTNMPITMPTDDGDAHDDGDDDDNVFSGIVIIMYLSKPLTSQ